MIAFASNSLLCRIALRETPTDAATFTSVRIVAGAVALWGIEWVRARKRGVPASWWQVGGSWWSALALFIYAAAFSFAYLRLSAGTGALLLFVAVQTTMILWGLLNGERLNLWQLAGIGIALCGLVLLVFPGIAAPPAMAALLMFAAGIAWGVYSIRGKSAGNAIRATAGNFIRAVPFVLVMSAIAMGSAHADRAGIVYALISGALASGLGYVIWYTALPALRATTAATVQLSAPVLAATGGILLLGEPLTARYFFASIAVLGGIGLVVGRRR